MQRKSQRNCVLSFIQYAFIIGIYFINADPWESEHFESLADDQAKEYAELFVSLEYFVRTARGIAVVKG